MDLLEIILLITGVAIILVSVLLIHNPEKENQTDTENNDNAVKQYIDKLSSLSENVIDRTEEYLNKISNEKIMAVSEYSDQILEKIDRNNEEVVFIYNMLTNKEKKLKDTLKELTDTQQKTRELLIKYREGQNRESPEDIYPGENTVNMNKTEEQNDNKSVSKKNEEILNLHSQGMSVLEISKKLGIGQGEVKLIIDLFGK